MTLKKLLIVLVVGMSVASVSAWGEEAKPEQMIINIGEMTCKQLMSGNDLDREVGIAFFHGYYAGKSNNQSVDLPKASALSTDVKDYCLSNPTSTVMDAFSKAGK